MPLPWEALIPIGLVTGMFAAGGVLLNTSRRVQNQGKSARYNVDTWDEMMMERDRRLTGHVRGQTTEIKPPKEFATNSRWHYVEKKEGFEAWL